MEKFSITFLLLIALTTTIRAQFQTPPFVSDVTPAEKQFRVVYEWNVLDFGFRTPEHRLNAYTSKEYIPENNILSDVKAYANRLYVTVPRMMPGVPATLGYVVSPNNNGKTNPEIEAFPSWEMNQIGNCSAFQFVQGIAIDADGIMWVVDSGRMETLAAPGARVQPVCNPKIVLIDLARNGTIIHRYEFPVDVVARGSNYLNKVVVDDAFGGFAYITDNSGADPGIVVYSRRLNKSWKIRENNSMRAALNAVQFAVNGTDLNFSIHIDGIALGPYYNPNQGEAINNAAGQGTYNDNFERNVYYCPLSSFHLYSIPASVLRDPEFARTATPRQVLERVTDHGLKISQTDGMIMDNHGILYFSLLKEHAIAQWDSYTPFTYENQHVVAKDDSFIQWTDGMGFDEEGWLYAVVNRLHNFVAGRLNPNVVNFRILRSRTGTLSYAYTNGLSTRRGSSENGILLHEAAYDTGSPFLTNNGFSTNGISSTTPQFSSLGGNPRYYNAGEGSLIKSNKLTYATVFIAMMFAYLLN